VARVRTCRFYPGQFSTLNFGSEAVSRVKVNPAGGAGVSESSTAGAAPVLAGDPALGEFPAEQPNDLPLSATAEAFYRSGPLFWQRYTSFWISSLLSRIVFFVIPVLAALIPVVGFTLSFYRWLHIRRAGRLYRALGKQKSASYTEH
jgi:hypothetical protein